MAVAGGSRRKPNCVGAIERRVTSRNLIEEMKSSKPPRRRTRPRSGDTFTTSFTINAMVDQAITDMAIEDGVSRSAIVRVAAIRLLNSRVKK